VRGADRREPLARGQPREPGADVQLSALLPAVHRPGCPPALPRGPGALPLLPGPRPGRPGVGRAADPGRAGVPVPQLRAGADDRVLPQSRRRDRVRAAPGGVGADRPAQTRAGGAAPGRRGTAGTPFSGAGWVVPPRAHRRLLRAGRAAARAVARLRRRGREAHNAMDEFFAHVQDRSRPAPTVEASRATTSSRCSTCSPSRMPSRRS